MRPHAASSSPRADTDGRGCNTSATSGR